MAGRLPTPKRKLRSPWQQLTRALSYQKKTPLSMPLRHRLEALRHGFRSSMYTFYELEHNDPGDFLPDTAFRNATNINGVLCQNILKDKLLFSEMLGGSFKVPQVFGLIDRGQFCALGEPTTLLELLEARGDLIFKPAGGWQGQGIFSVSQRGETLSLNGRAVVPSTLTTQCARLSGYLVTECIVQDGYAHEIFPASVNSVRITTMQDPDDDHRPFVAIAVQRFGSSTTVPTDNVSRGGLMANIDLETGVMGSAIKFPHETGGELYWCSHHPDTAAPIKGQKVPNWAGIQEQLLGLVRAYPFFRYVGWDIVITQGEAWLVEGNHNPSPAVQIFHPYLRDPKIRRFFSYHGVI